MKKRIFTILLGAAMLLGGCAKSDTTASITSESDTATSEHVHNLAIVDGYEATCQAEGLQVIGCTSCSFILEETVLEKVECELAENGKCKWCGQTLEDLLPWIGTLEHEFISVTQIHEYYGVAPGNFKDVVRSESETDKAAMLAFLKNHSLVQVSEREAQISGGGGVTMEFETESGVYTLTRANGFFHIDGKYYKSKTPVPELTDGEDCHAFVTYTGTAILRIDGVTMRGYVGLIDEIYFRPLEGVEIEMPEGPSYELVFDLEGKIALVGITWFHYDGNLYEVVGGVDFSQIFVDYPCDYNADGLCDHCGQENEGIAYREEYKVYLCDSCYQEYEDVIMLPCCFCGSYDCNGDCQDEENPQTLCENCGQDKDGITYREEYYANLCDSCYQEYEDSIILPCSFCGSYVCKGDCQD